MCDNNTEFNWCDGKTCTQAVECYGSVCNNGECDSIDLGDLEGAAAGMATGIIILIIVCVVLPCCAIVGCIVCCVMGVGFCAKKGAEAAAAQ